jgi:glyoxylase-like metal-dependent hydrolase (beta-lactamase superfamily II)
MNVARTETLAAAEVPFAVELAAVRRIAKLIPGEQPLAVNGVRVAASIRPQRFVIEGGDDTPVIMPRTAFQVVYRDSTVMIDSGLDQMTHDSFAEGGKREPYFPDQFAKLQQALNAARLIVLTHFHADHVAGVLRAPNFDELAQKTVITSATADFLVNRPHRPHLKMTPQAVEKFIVVDYARYYPLAPGIVLIKSPGHSPDSQMVFIALRCGREILHSVDSAWNFENIRQVKGKAAPWVKEDVPAILGQLRFLNRIHTTEPELTILVTHDDGLFEHVTQSGLVGRELAY